MSNDNYKKKFDEFIKCIPDNMYVFELTKLCGYGEFLLVYKDAPINDIYKSVSYKFGNSDIKFLFFMNAETKQQYQLPNTNIFTVRELIAKFQNNHETKCLVKPIYDNIDSLVIYRLYYDDGHAHDCCNIASKI
jgi:hypothetical protein